MITNEQLFFLHIINDYIHDRKTQNRKDVDWKEILDYAQSHQLTPIIYTQCKDFIPSEESELLRSNCFNALSCGVRRKKITDDTLSEFRITKMNFFLVKGDVVADYYPYRYHRTMGDVDIIVNDKQKAHNRMVQMGFEPVSLPENHEWTYQKGDCKIELHDDLIYDIDDVAYDKAKLFFRSFWEYVRANELDINFHFSYLFLHLRKHFMKRGVGFRQFLDIALMVKNSTELNWDVVESFLKQCDLFLFAQIVCEYNERWFGVKSPFGNIEIADSVFAESTNYVFKNGIFGFDNEETKNNIQMLRSRKSKFPIVYMCKDALSRIFLPYSAMVKLDYCSFVNRRPLLLPIAWIKRIIYTLTKKGIKIGAEQMSSAFVSKNSIIRREELFRNWGLQ